MHREKRQRGFRVAGCVALGERVRTGGGDGRNSVEGWNAWGICARETGVQERQQRQEPSDLRPQICVMREPQIEPPR